MRPALPRDIPRRAAIVVCSLALLASVVTGREEEDSPASAPPGQTGSAATAPASRGGESPAPASDDLDVEKLVRLRRENSVPDLFASRAWTPKPVASVASQSARSGAAVPQAPPPLAFRYFGKIIDAGRVFVFLEKGGETYRAGEGDMVDGQYRVERIGDSGVTLTYLPLGASQVLPVDQRH